MSTYTLKPKDIDEQWHIVDATGVSLGRLASDVAATLRGKKRPTFQPSMGNGDFVIVVNAAQIKITGDMTEKKYYRHSQYPGGLKSISQEKLLATKPERVIEYAVKGMLPHNAHGSKLLKHLKVYAGPDHPHHSQVNAGKGGAKANSAKGAGAKKEAAAAKTEAAKAEAATAVADTDTENEAVTSEATA